MGCVIIHTGVVSCCFVFRSAVWVVVLHGYSLVSKLCSTLNKCHMRTSKSSHILAYRFLRFHILKLRCCMLGYHSQYVGDHNTLVVSLIVDWSTPKGPFSAKFRDYVINQSKRTSLLMTSSIPP